MTDYLTLSEFTPGTKARPEEINANFGLLKNAMLQKASIQGDITKTFSVAPAEGDTHAVNKAQLDALSQSLTDEISKVGAKFCAKSGNVSVGKPDLFGYSGLTITPKIGGAYSNLVVSDYLGAKTTITFASSISMSGKTDGVYNIFVKPDGTLYVLKNKIYRQASRPTMVDGDIWLNTSVEPLSCIKYDGVSDNEFSDVPLGVVTLASSAITSVETFAFNQNGYDINGQTLGQRLYVSGLYALVNNTPTIVSHNLNLSAEELQHARATAKVNLKCVVAEGGYSPGDYAIGWSTMMEFSGGYAQTIQSPLVTANAVQINTGINSTALIVMANKANGAIFSGAYANWKYEFTFKY